MPSPSVFMCFLLSVGLRAARGRDGNAEERALALRRLKHCGEDAAVDQRQVVDSGQQLPALAVPLHLDAAVCVPPVFECEHVRAATAGRRADRDLVYMTAVSDGAVRHPAGSERCAAGLRVVTRGEETPGRGVALLLRLLDLLQRP